MSILISAWEPFETSLLEWRRLCKRMDFLASSEEVEVDRHRSYLGKVLWGIEPKKSGGTSLMLAVCWEWREVIPNVLALSNPLGIESNVLLKDETGAVVEPSKRVLHLNAAVSSFRWQTRLIRHAELRRNLAA